MSDPGCAAGELATLDEAHRLLRRWDEHWRRFGFGYWVVRRRRHRLGRREHPDRVLIARIRPPNVASQRVAIHAGLARAGHLDAPGEDGVDWIFVSARR